MNEIFPKIDHKFYSNVLTTKLMNMFGYSIITPFIIGNKDYHSCCNPHSMYQTYPRFFRNKYNIQKKNTHTQYCSPQFC